MTTLTIPTQSESSAVMIAHIKFGVGVAVTGKEKVTCKILAF